MNGAPAVGRAETGGFAEMFRKRKPGLSKIDNKNPNGIGKVRVYRPLG
jgi:hypothetical protein